MQDDDFEEAALMQLILEAEAGIHHNTDTVEDLIQQRFG
jgi:hypothetical protein